MEIKRIALLVSSILCANFAHSAEIDLVLNQENDNLAPANVVGPNERAQLVQLNTAPFSAFTVKENQINQADLPSVINLELFDNQSVRLILENYQFGTEGIVLWNGHVEGSPADKVNLAIFGDIIQGNVNIGIEQFQIRFLSEDPNGDVTHTIIQRDPDDVLPEHDPSQPPIPPGNGSNAEFDVGVNDALSDDGTVQDVLIVYTPSARSAAGGTSAMVALINLAVSETNTGYANSNVSFTLNLSHTEEISYVEVDFVTDVNRLQGKTDGFMDGVHALRDAHFADMVGLISTTPAFCGRAFAINASEDEAFHVTRWDCATGNFSFAHEFGHLQAARHNWFSDPTNNSPFTYNHAYMVQPEDWRTIMSVNDTACPGFVCTRVNYWSNPNVNFPSTGTPMGIPDGMPEPSQNARALNTTAFAVANFRQRADQYEPDNTQAQATPLISGVVQPNHSIHLEGADEDWATFTLTCESDIDLQTNGLTGDTTMSLFDSTGTLVEFDDDDGVGLFSRIQRQNVLPGVYFVEIQEFAQNNAIMNYSLSLAATQTGTCLLCDGLAVTVDIGAGDLPTSGNDVILGTPGPDSIMAGGGSDTVCGLGGADFISGGDGADTIFGDGGNDIIYGGAGTDVIHGGNNDDELYGDGGSDTINGDGGDDLIEGRSGNDTIRGGAGVDAIAGGNGNDVIYTGLGATVGSGVKVTGGLGADVIHGGDDADEIEGGNASDIIYGEGGADILKGGNGADTIHGGTGPDNILGNGFTDTLFGDGGSDVIVGGGGSDIIYGGTANDVLAGNAGNDEIFGEAGNDSLIGGPGNDDLNGGANVDTCNGGTGSQDTATASCETQTNIP